MDSEGINVAVNCPQGAMYVRCLLSSLLHLRTDGESFQFDQPIRYIGCKPDFCPQLETIREGTSSMRLKVVINNGDRANPKSETWMLTINMNASKEEFKLCVRSFISFVVSVPCKASFPQTTSFARATILEKT